MLCYTAARDCEGTVDVARAADDEVGQGWPGDLKEGLWMDKAIKLLWKGWPRPQAQLMLVTYYSLWTLVEDHSHILQVWRCRLVQRGQH